MAAPIEVLQLGEAAELALARRSRFEVAFAQLVIEQQPGAGQEDESRTITPHWLGGDPQPETLIETAAAAHVRAAVAALALGDEAAFDLLSIAARQYQRAGLPYGLFLAYLQPQGEGDGRDLERAIRAALPPRVAGPDAPDSEPTPDREWATDALAHPVQQAYLVLGASSLGSSSAEGLTSSAQTLLDQLEPHGAMPFGPQGAPLYWYLDIARALLSEDFDDHRQQAEVAIRRLARRHQESVEVARRNSYRWNLGLSPTVLVDVDALLLAAAMVQRWGSDLAASIGGVTGSAVNTYLHLWQRAPGEPS